MGGGDKDCNACIPLFLLNHSLTNTAPELNKAKTEEWRDSGYDQVLLSCMEFSSPQRRGVRHMDNGSIISGMTCVHL